MNPHDFRRIVTAFADRSGPFRWDRDRLVVQVRDELIEAGVREHEAEVRVRENGKEFPASSWLTDRLAGIPRLADRILASIPEEPFFIAPAGDCPAPLAADPAAPPRRLPDVRQGLEQALAEPPRDRTTVLYLTSGAGEGKTTLLHQAARLQAARYRRGESGFLLLPVHLGGRPFLLFEDLLIREFGRLRFPFFCYDAFLELVKLGVLVPAFDGFEEVFAERVAGCALSTLGALLHDLDSSGMVVISAPRAVFEYPDFETQAQLLDPIGECDVVFRRIRLDRWDRTRFLRYAERRGSEKPEDFYEQFRRRLGEGHPALTRAVLVHRLVEVAERGGSDDLLRGLAAAGADPLRVFVNAVVEQEVREKWIVRSGSGPVGRPLLSVAEQHALLAQIALEMWLFSLDALPEDILETDVARFAGARGTPAIAAEIGHRLRQHPLLVRVPERRKFYGFAHEDFRHFYFGEALAGVLVAADEEWALSQALLAGPLPRVAADAVVNALRRRGADPAAVAERLRQLVTHPLISDLPANAGEIVVRLLEVWGDAEPARFFRFGFPAEALRGRRLGSAVFEECVFQGTSLDGADLSACRFERCTFIRLELPPAFAAGGAVLDGCRVLGLVRDGDPDEIYAGIYDGIYDEQEIETALAAAGFTIERSEPSVPPDRSPPDRRPTDPAVRLAERALRCFFRATQIEEEVFEHRLGKQQGRFFDSVLPRMLDRGVLRPVECRGDGQQRRFALAVPMRRIAPGLTTSGASLEEFLEALVRED